MMYELDLSIGRLLNEVEKLGLKDNTYVIFKSDNGYRRFDTQNFTQPFFGRKWFLWQAGIRVPMIVRSPGKVPAGSTSNQLMGHVDMLATIAALTEQKLDKSEVEMVQQLFSSRAAAG